MNQVGCGPRLQNMPPIDPPVGLALMEAYIQLSTVRKALCNELRGSGPMSEALAGLLVAEKQITVEVETLLRSVS